MVAISFKSLCVQTNGNSICLLNITLPAWSLVDWHKVICNLYKDISYKSKYKDTVLPVQEI